MKNVLASLVCSAALVAAAPVSVSFVNPGTPGIVDSSGSYVGPYTLTIDGQNTPAMCMDDFFSTGGTWTAYLTNVTSTGLGNTYMGNSTFQIAGFQLSSSEIYIAEAYLDSELLQPGADRVTIQDAAWTIMDYVTGHAPHSAPSDSAVASVIQDVSNNAGSFDASAYEIVSEANGDPSNAEQEFLVPVATPEPASFALLGGALVLFGVKQSWSKKRKCTEPTE